jgi:hypothetical protein|tara:strand:- start:79 stop:249 length:171 start_codon:yes stop_codon:yes gene_type:complete
MGMLIKSDNKAALPVLQSSHMLGDNLQVPFIQSGTGMPQETTPKVINDNSMRDIHN